MSVWTSQPRSMLVGPAFLELRCFSPAASGSGGPGKGRFRLLRLRRHPQVPHFRRFFIRLSVSLPAFDLFACPPARERSAVRQNQSHLGLSHPAAEPRIIRVRATPCRLPACACPLIAGS
jgi:hypothetical protein